MGLFDKIVSKLLFHDFIPDFQKTEYDNWLDFLEKGGTSEEWEILKKDKNLNFLENSFEQYQNESKEISDRYYYLLSKIEKDWSKLYASKDYNSKLSEAIEKDCLESIELFSKLYAINQKYDEKSPENIPAFRRLAMLYERRGDYDAGIQVCKNAWCYKMNETGRMSSMIKKLHREPTHEESSIIDEASAYYASLTAAFDKKENESKTGRQAISAEQIDAMQRIEASEKYRKKIYKTFYSDYPEKPFISKDREINTQWLNQASIFPLQSIIPKKMMTRYKDGLLPGHIYLLYWLNKYTLKRRIPSYFEYKYGIEVLKELTFLIDNGYVGPDNKPTDKGIHALNMHYEVIESH